MALVCSVNVSGTALGTLCVSYTNCNATCCTATYSSCGGTHTANCTSCTVATTCCSYTTPSCGGTNSAACTAGSGPACTSSPCCKWTAPTGPCVKKDCADVAQGSCVTCGCTPAGGCAKRTCSSLSEANCPTCGCTKSGTCPAKSCATLATTNLSLCAGCNLCSGTATITNTVDLRSYWSVTARIFTFSGVGATLIEDATHKRTYNSAI